jgi:GAF domain-containing protein
MFSYQSETCPASPVSGPDLLPEAVKAMLESEQDLIAGLANVSALVKLYLSEVNWAGFYLLKGQDLVLGPFQGLPACARIGWGRGVCGRAVLEQKPVLVSDVHAFPGHIACDSASASEIVVPLFKSGQVFGVLDIDSPRQGHFSEVDADFIERACRYINDFLERLGD